jgi:hypothetical protein
MMTVGVLSLQANGMNTDAISTIIKLKKPESYRILADIGGDS